MTQTTRVKHDLKHDSEKEAEYHLLWSGTSVGHHVTETPLSWHLSGAWKAAPRKPEPEEVPPFVGRAAAWNQHSHGAVGQGQMFGQLSYSITSLLVLELPAHLPSLVLCLSYRTAATPS